SERLTPAFTKAYQLLRQGRHCRRLLHGADSYATQHAEQTALVLEREELHVPPAAGGTFTGKKTAPSPRLAPQDLRRGGQQSGPHPSQGPGRGGFPRGTRKATSLDRGKPGQGFPRSVDEQQPTAAVEHEQRVARTLEKRPPAEVVRAHAASPRD